MRTLFLAGAAALTLAAVPAALIAQPAPQTSSQANAQPTLAPTTTVSTRPSGQTVVTTNNPGNLTPPPASTLNKTYPPCTRTLQDSCQNPGEGGAPRR